MTRENAKELLPILTAFANGEEVQFNNGLSWKTQNELSFEGNPQHYRIAPKPRKVWVNEYKSGSAYIHSTKGEADQCARWSCELVACYELELPPLP